jgi:hypothetical protein
MTGLVWMYAVITAADATAPDDLPGVAGEPVRVVRAAASETDGASADETATVHGTVAAVVSSVPEAEFAEEPLKQHLEDLRWLESAARAHHRVIDTAFRRGDIVPLQFATVYRDDDSVRAMLRDRAADLAQAMARVRGRAEWGVKAYMDPAAAGATPGPDGQEGGGPGGAGRNPGTAYLLRRKAQQTEREDAYRRAQDRSADVREALEALAVRMVAHPPQDPRLAEYEGWMIRNDSFLVDQDHADEFTSAVRVCAERFPDVDVELSGPWPPYSFVGDPEEPRA